MTTALLSASILSANFRFLENEIRSSEEAGVDWIHIDVMDGHFVPNISMGPFIVEFCREITNLPIDVHLMIESPEKYVQAFASAGANYLTIHPESNPNILRTLQQIHELGCKAGLALNPGTPGMIASPLVRFVDLILVMTVNPGYSGQSFIPEMISKIAEIQELVQERGETSLLVQVDGGINESNIQTVKSAGADVIVSASAIFKHPQGIAAGVKALRKALD